MAQRICQVLHRMKCHSVFLSITCDGHFSGSRKCWEFTEKFECSLLIPKVTPNTTHDDTRSAHMSASKRREDKICLGHLTDDSTWVSICCDHSVFCHSCIKCLQPLPHLSLSEIKISLNLSVQVLLVITSCWLNFAKTQSQVTNWSNISYLVFLTELVFWLPCSSEALGNIWWSEDLSSGPV